MTAASEYSKERDKIKMVQLKESPQEELEVREYKRQSSIQVHCRRCDNEMANFEDIERVSTKLWLIDEDLLMWYDKSNKFIICARCRHIVAKKYRRREYKVYKGAVQLNHKS